MPFDSTLALRLDPYRHISRRCAREGTDGFETRVLLERTVCLSGVEAARVFYDPALFRRADAAPGFLKKTLFGTGGVQGLDGAAHRSRKAQFLDLLGPPQARDLAARVGDEIARFAGSGAGRARFRFQDRMEILLTEVICGWAGVPVDDLPALSRMLSALFEHAGSVGLGQIRARRARRRADGWAAALIAEVRAGRRDPGADTPLARVADWRGEGGELLPLHAAAVELLNVLRPFVAISAYLTFGLRELALRPGLAAALRDDPERLPAFVQEVRRTAPFFPVAAARADRPTRWRDIAIPEGRLVLLDLWGTNRDPAAWDAPGDFRAERFEGRRIDPFELVPQGGGGHLLNHRCAGEWVTIGVMQAAFAALLATRFDLPEQDLELDMRALPGLPRDRLVLTGLRPR